METNKTRKWFLRFNEEGTLIGYAFAVGPHEVADAGENWIACDEETVERVKRGERFAPGLDGALNRVDPPREERIKAAKARRNSLIAATDWTQTDDAKENMSEEKSAAWKAYRQALRDVPQQAGFPDVISWPVAPL